MKRRRLSCVLLPMLLPICGAGQEEPTPTTTLVSNSPTLLLPGSLTLTSTVTPPAGTGGVPTGNVQFYFDGTNSLGTAPLSIVPSSESFPAGAGATTNVGTTSFGLITLNYTGSKYSLLGALDYQPSSVISAASISYPRLTIYSGKGANLFGTAATYNLPAGATTPYSIFGGVDAFAVADFNHDGIPDVLLHGPASDGSVYYVLPGTGMGTFDTTKGIATQDPTPCDCSSLEDKIAVDDFNGDGYPDVAFISGRTGAMGSGLNGGVGAPGTFAKFSPLPAVGLPETEFFSPTTVTTGHLTGSGHADIVVAGNVNSVTGAVVGGELAIYLGNGDGSFANPVLVPAGNNSTQVATADFRNSGITDVVVANSDGVVVYFGDGKGGLTPSSSVALGAGVSVSVADFNDDGFPDILAIVRGTPFLLLNNQKGQFFKPTTFTTISGLTDSVSGDFNGDGLTDIAAFAAIAGAAVSPAYVFFNSASAQAQLATAPMTLPSGAHTLTATFPADSDFATSTSAGVAVTVTQTIPSLTWAQPAPIEYGIALSATQLDATSNVVGTFSYSPAGGIVLPPGQNKLSAMFVPTDTFDYAGATASQTIAVTAPTLTGVAPNAASLGVATTLTVTGQGLLNGAVVEWNGTALTTTWVSLGQLTAAVPAALVNAPGAATVTVVDPNNVAVAGSATVTVSSATLTGISPISGNLGAALTLTVNGQGFLNGAVVEWNGSALATTWVSLTQLTAAVPALLLTAPGAVTITVVDPNKVSVAGTQTFTISAPTLASISPTSGTLGSAITLTITGQGLLNGAVVQWNGSPLTTTWVSLTQLTATVPASLLTSPGTVTVTVVDPKNVSVTGKQTFTIAAPTLTSISPTSASLGAGNTTITIAGQGFLNGAVVEWNNSPLATTWVSLTQLTAVVPASLLTTPGPSTITVVDPNRVSVSGQQTFTVVGSATLAGISPTNAGLGAPITLTVTGQGLLNGAIVQWNGSPLATTWVSLTQLTAAVPATLLTAPGTATVTVVDPNNLSVTGKQTFTIAGPTLTGISPTTVNLGASNTTLTVTGQGFLTGAVVEWNGSPLATTWVSLTKLTAVVPASLLTTAETATVSVVDPNKVSVSGTQAFSVLAGAAVVQATVPSTAEGGSPQTIGLTINPYPVGITVTLTLSFTPASPNEQSDPTVMFTNGGTTDTFTVDPNSSAAISPISFSPGSTAGTITLTIQLDANGTDVTPSGLSPINITVPAGPPVITSATLTRNGDAMSVTVLGLSTTRDMSQAEFHFTPASGQSLGTTDLTVPLTSPFTTFYQSSSSDVKGTMFQYVQPFTLNSDASKIGSVTVTLSNSQGASQPSTAQ